MWKPQTVHMRNAIEGAQSEARALNQEFVGAEHLALGLLAGNDTEARSALAAQGIDPAIVAGRLRSSLPIGKQSPFVTGPLPLSPKAQEAFHSAVVRASNSDTPISTRLVLLALLQEPTSDVAQAFAAEGIDLVQLGAALAQRPTEQEQ